MLQLLGSFSGLNISYRAWRRRRDSALGLCRGSCRACQAALVEEVCSCGNGPSKVVRSLRLYRMSTDHVTTSCWPEDCFLSKIYRLLGPLSAWTECLPKTSLLHITLAMPDKQETSNADNACP